MSSYLVKETFFRPREVRRELSSLPASIHNRLRLLLSRASGASLFIPIRAMQYLAVAEREEVIFIDAQGGYAHHQGEGGRLIRLAWWPVMEKSSLCAPVPCEMVYYFEDNKAIQLRLLAEIGPAMDRLLAKERGQEPGIWEGRILPFHRQPQT
jgi:hypothetical protein